MSIEVYFHGIFPRNGYNFINVPLPLTIHYYCDNYQEENIDLQPLISYSNSVKEWSNYFELNDKISKYVDKHVSKKGFDLEEIELLKTGNFVERYIYIPVTLVQRRNYSQYLNSLVEYIDGSGFVKQGLVEKNHIKISCNIEIDDITSPKYPNISLNKVIILSKIQGNLEQ